MIAIKKTVLWFFWLTLLLTATARADEPLTWEECVKRATENNPDVAATLAALKSAEALHQGAYANFLPSISATGSVTTASGSIAGGGGNGGLAPVGSGNNGPQTQYSAGLTATESIFNGFADTGKVKQTGANVEAAKAALALAKSNVSAAVKTAFAELLYSQKTVDLSDTILKRALANLRLVSLRFEGGRENKGNQLFQEATVAQARYQFQHADRAVRVASKQLGLLIGSPENDSLRVAGELDTHPYPAVTDFAGLVAKHPGHLQASYQYQSSKAAVQVANAAWFPTLSANGFVGRLGPDFPPENNRWSVGATLTIPIPGLTTISNVQSANALELQADYTQRSVDNKLRLGLEQTYSGLKDAIEQVQVAKDFQTAAHSRSRISTEKYNTGLMSFDDWSVIETDLVNREQTLLLNQRNAVQAEATWENAQGIGAIP